jgi:peptide-methionine (R)-S-oxide reductase
MSTPAPAQPPADDELRDRLTPMQYEVTQRQATEPPFTGEYWNCHEDGTYHCIVCDEPLFSSETKFESGTGWPSFYQPVREGVVEVRRDVSHGMVREEIVCTRCGAHLGHVFPDGPQPTGDRYCMNSASLRLTPGETAPTSDG